MISESVSQMLNHVHLIHNSNIPVNTPSDRPESRSTFSSRSSDVSSHRGTSNILSLSTEMVTTIIQNWHIKFDGSNQGLCVDEFIYRIRKLAKESLQEDLGLVCKNLLVLLKGISLNWYWRFHERADRIRCESFCMEFKRESTFTDGS